MGAQMPFAVFQESTAGGTPPPGLSGPLRALWLDATGRWDEAHVAAQAAEWEASTRALLAK